MQSDKIHTKTVGNLKQSKLLRKLLWGDCYNTPGNNKET